MLSSIILSLVMTTSPATVTESHTLKLKEVGQRRGRRINSDTLDINEAGQRRGRRI